MEEARACSAEEKEDLKFLLERAIIEERRKAEVKRGGLKFSASVSQLEQSLAG